MGYNISDVGGQATGGVDIWTATLDLGDPSATTISGNFEVVPLYGGGSGEAASYTFSALSNPSLGTLSFDSSTGQYTFTVDRAAAFQNGPISQVSFSVTGQSGGNTDTDTVEITILTCLARGTLVDTPAGPVPVETLEPGDLVRTLDGPPRPLRWVGHRRVSAAELTADPSLRPIRIAKGALGRNAPRRDLVVSPQHRVLVRDWRAQLLFGEDQVLAPAKALVDDWRIRVDPACAGVEYFHLLFDDHQVIFTEGAPTESFHPGHYSLGGMAEATRRELLRLFPELDAPEGYGATARVTLRGWEAELMQRAG